MQSNAWPESTKPRAESEGTIESRERDGRTDFQCPFRGENPLAGTQESEVGIEELPGNENRAEFCSARFFESYAAVSSALILVPHHRAERSLAFPGLRASPRNVADFIGILGLAAGTTTQSPSTP